MFENLGVCKGPGEVLAHIHIGADCLNISKVGKCFNVLLNNRTLVSASSKKNFHKKVTPVLSHVALRMCKEAQQDAMRWKRVEHNYTKMIDKVLKNIQRDSRPADVYVLEVKPDEVQDNRTTGYEASAKKSVVEKLDNYRFSLNKWAETIENLNHTSGVLLKTHLDKKMWGSKDVMDIIEDVKYESDILGRDLSKIDCCFERSDENAYKIQKIVSKKIATSHTKEIVGAVIDNFAKIKSFMSDQAQVLHRLYAIDNTFKTKVGYPATWFFDGSIFMDFTFEYENLINHLIKSASLEADTIEPLLVWKIKLTGV